ncbi:hypothetical protein OC835_003489 [Tilletia horrida]|nr:hypothetical protein OC835_003489 [Tilletia horrida]
MPETRRGYKTREEEEEAAAARAAAASTQPHGAEPSQVKHEATEGSTSALLKPEPSAEATLPEGASLEVGEPQSGNKDSDGDSDSDLSSLSSLTDLSEDENDEPESEELERAPTPAGNESAADDEEVAAAEAAAEHESDAQVALRFQAEQEVGRRRSARQSSASGSAVHTQPPAKTDKKGKGRAPAAAVEPDVDPSSRTDASQSGLRKIKKINAKLRPPLHDPPPPAADAAHPKPDPWDLGVGPDEEEDGSGDDEGRLAEREQDFDDDGGDDDEEDNDADDTFQLGGSGPAAARKVVSKAKRSVAPPTSQKATPSASQKAASAQQTSAPATSPSKNRASGSIIAVRKAPGQAQQTKSGFLPQERSALRKAEAVPSSSTSTLAVDDRPSAIAKTAIKKSRTAISQRPEAPVAAPVEAVTAAKASSHPVNAPQDGSPKELMDWPSSSKLPVGSRQEEQGQPKKEKAGPYLNQEQEEVARKRLSELQGLVAHLRDSIKPNAEKNRKKCAVKIKVIKARLAATDRLRATQTSSDLQLTDLAKASTSAKTLEKAEAKEVHRDAPLAGSSKTSGSQLKKKRASVMDSDDEAELAAKEERQRISDQRIHKSKASTSSVPGPKIKVEDKSLGSSGDRPVGSDATGRHRSGTGPGTPLPPIKVQKRPGMSMAGAGSSSSSNKPSGVSAAGAPALGKAGSAASSSAQMTGSKPGGAAAAATAATLAGNKEQEWNKLLYGPNSTTPAPPAPAPGIPNIPKKTPSAAAGVKTESPGSAQRLGKSKAAAAGMRSGTGTGVGTVVQMRNPDKLTENEEELTEEQMQERKAQAMAEYDDDSVAINLLGYDDNITLIENEMHQWDHMGLFGDPRSYTRLGAVFARATFLPLKEFAEVADPTLTQREAFAKARAFRAARREAKERAQSSAGNGLEHKNGGDGSSSSALHGGMGGEGGVTPGGRSTAGGVSMEE